MKNPLARRRSSPPDGAAGTPEQPEQPEQPEGDAPVADAPAADAPAAEARGRLVRLLGTTNRAYLVVAAVALLVGPSAGATTRLVPRPAPAAAAVDEKAGTAADEPPDEPVEPEVAPDDGRRRYLVALATRSAATTTTVPVTTTEAHAAPTTTTTTTAAHAAPTAPRASVIAVTILASDETQWVDVVRLDGSRLVILVPVRYLRLVADDDPAAAPFAGARPPERAVVQDRDGRYWSTARNWADPTLYELPGQLPNAPEHASDEPDHAATTAAAAGGTTSSTRALRPWVTTTTLSPAPPALVDPIPAQDREVAIALAALPGVLRVSALGPGVLAVVGTVDPAALAAVPGVARVRVDSLF